MQAIKTGPASEPTTDALLSIDALPAWHAPGDTRAALASSQASESGPAAPAPTRVHPAPQPRAAAMPPSSIRDDEPAMHTAQHDATRAPKRRSGVIAIGLGVAAGALIAMPFIDWRTPPATPPTPVASRDAAKVLPRTEISREIATADTATTQAEPRPTDQRPAIAAEPPTPPSLQPAETPVPPLENIAAATPDTIEASAQPAAPVSEPVPPPQPEPAQPQETAAAPSPIEPTPATPETSAAPAQTEPTSTDTASLAPAPLTGDTGDAVQPVEAASRPRVVIHYSGARERARAEAVARQIGGSFGAVDLRMVTFPIRQTELRIFDAGDETRAKRLADVAAAAIATRPRVDNFDHYRPRPTPGLIEVWLRNSS